MSYQEHNPAREAWLRDNVPRSQLPRRPPFVEPEGSNEWTSTKLPRKRRPQTEFKTPDVPAPPAQEWSSHFPAAGRERQLSPETMHRFHLDDHSPEPAVSAPSPVVQDWHYQSPHADREGELSPGRNMLPHRSRKDSPETGVAAARSRPTSPFEDWLALLPRVSPEPEDSAGSMLSHHSRKDSQEIEIGAGIRKFSPGNGLVSRSRSSSIETIIRRLSPQMVIPTIVEPHDDAHGKSETTKGSPGSAKVLHATFEELPTPPNRSKASTPSEAALRPKTPHPSVTKSKSASGASRSQPTTGLTSTPESKDTKDSKGTAPTKPHRSKTIHPPKVSELKAAFNTFMNGRTAPKALAADVKSAFNTLRSGTLRPPKESSTKSSSAPNLKQTGNIKPPPQKSSERNSAPHALQPTDRLSIPSNPATSTKSTRPATPHPESAQARTMPRRGTTVRLNGTVAGHNLAAGLHHTPTEPIEDRTLRVRNASAVLEVREQQLRAPSLDSRANDQASSGPSVPPRTAGPSVPRATTPYAEPYGCNTLNGMPAYFEEVETNNFRAVTASHRPPDRKMIDVHGLPCGHRSVCLDPMALGYAVVFDQAGNVCARIFVGEGHLVAYKNAPFVYIETVLGTRLRVDVSRNGTFVLDEAGELVKEEEGVDVGYNDWVDPRAAKPNTKGLMMRGWKACKGWMGTVKGTVKGKFKGKFKTMGGKED